ncbi:hypothetical protein B0T26DRAFT_691108 [Lasiosphaeria miniovina]|uniref:Uncharacterized protein n=1 Tax=Lasiosphaeria miniovina TaxID=1954250 RepID=A0AA40BJ77_9PEZI|nr:uncharacterized protein B0T26DRAFT_691108 [Lasiosphaeria miniovina]KAK0735193.1 hypothetical protein B0T26DRAFT_691108 [Lasiosphaeria miniovina]
MLCASCVSRANQCPSKMLRKRRAPNAATQLGDSTAKFPPTSRALQFLVYHIIIIVLVLVPAAHLLDSHVARPIPRASAHERSLLVERGRNRRPSNAKPSHAAAGCAVPGGICKACVVCVVCVACVVCVVHARSNSATGSWPATARSSRWRRERGLPRERSDAQC